MTSAPLVPEDKRSIHATFYESGHGWEDEVLFHLDRRFPGKTTSGDIRVTKPHWTLKRSSEVGSYRRERGTSERLRRPSTHRQEDSSDTNGSILLGTKYTNSPLLKSHTQTGLGFSETLLFVRESFVSVPLTSRLHRVVNRPPSTSGRHKITVSVFLRIQERNQLNFWSPCLFWVSLCVLTYKFVQIPLKRVPSVK